MFYSGFTSTVMLIIFGVLWSVIEIKVIQPCCFFFIGSYNAGFRQCFCLSVSFDPNDLRLWHID